MAADEPASRMKRKAYEKELEKLQVQLCHLQEWVKANKLRVIVLFEGRDAAARAARSRRSRKRSAHACFAWSPFPHRRIAKRRNYSFSGICSIFRLQARSRSSTVAGTTAPASNMSWASVRLPNTTAFFRSAPR